MRIITQDSRSPDRDSNRAPPACRSEALPLELTCSVPSLRLVRICHSCCMQYPTHPPRFEFWTAPSLCPASSARETAETADTLTNSPKRTSDLIYFCFEMFGLRHNIEGFISSLMIRPAFQRRYMEQPLFHKCQICLLHYLYYLILHPTYSYIATRIIA